MFASCHVYASAMLTLITLCCYAARRYYARHYDYADVAYATFQPYATRFATSLC